MLLSRHFRFRSVDFMHLIVYRCCGIYNFNRSVDDFMDSVQLCRWFRFGGVADLSFSFSSVDVGGNKVRQPEYMVQLEVLEEDILHMLQGLGVNNVASRLGLQ